MAENFFTGLTGAIQQNAKQRNNDDYIELMRQRQLQSEMSGALAEKRAAAADVRADEEMGMKREAAIRTQKDFDFRMSEAERKRSEDTAFKQGSKELYEYHFGQKPEKDPEGNVLLDDKGAPRMKAPSPSDPAVLGSYIGDFTRHLANSGRMDPAAFKQLSDLRTTMEKDGTAKALGDWILGDAKPANALAERFGYDPQSMNMKVELDAKTGLYTTYLYATSKDGKPVKQNLSIFQMALGLPQGDPAAAQNEKVIAGDRMKNDGIRSAAAMANANRPRGGGGGGDDDGGPETGGLSLKAFNKEASLFNDNINQSQPRYSFAVGEVLGPDQKGEKVDEFKKEKLRDFGMRALRTGAATNATDAQTIALRTFDAYESDALKNIRFTEDPKTRVWRVSYDPKDKTVPYNSRLVPEQQRIAGRNAAVEVRLREALERDRARTAAIKK